MRWIKKDSLFFGILSLGVLLIAWESRSFVLLLVAAALALASLAMQLASSQAIATSMIAVLLSTALAEVFVGQLLGFDSVYYDPETGYTNTFSRFVEGFGSRPNPGSHNVRKLFKDGEVLYDVVYSIGADSYRQDLAAGPFDAHIFGGSFTFGEGLNDNETLSSFLLHEHGINVKNFGVHGYGVHQALYNIQNGMSSVDGLNILVTAPFHIPRSTCMPSWVVGSFRYEISDDIAILNGVCPGGFLLNRIVSKSKIYSLINKISGVNIYAITDADIALYLVIINTIFQESIRNNSSFMIAYIDGLDQEFESTSWTNETLMTHLKGISHSLIDITLADKTEYLSKRFFIHDKDRHPSAKANQARANLISEGVQSPMP